MQTPTPQKWPYLLRGMALMVLMYGPSGPDGPDGPDQQIRTCPRMQLPSSVIREDYISRSHGGPIEAPPLNPLGKMML